jgi:phosphoadenosine phosphosulfate reductase
MSEPVPLLAPLQPKQLAARLWRLGAFVVDDWRRVGDEEPLPISGRAIVSLARWRRECAALQTANRPFGVRIEAGEAIGAGDRIDASSLVALVFPKFSDGRAYSIARRQREVGFAGEIRATGDVLLDQLPLMLRAGFDAFEIKHLATISALDRGLLPAVPQVYQSGAEHGPARETFRRRSTHAVDRTRTGTA